MTMRLTTFGEIIEAGIAHQEAAAELLDEAARADLPERAAVLAARAHAHATLALAHWAQAGMVRR